MVKEKIVKCEYVDYNGSDDNFVESINGEIKSVYVSYDGGRFSVNINGKEVFNTLSASNDISFSVDKI